MRVSITCEDCGYRHRLERQITAPGPIWIVCHSCELPLQAVLESPVPSQKHVPAVWAGILDMGAASSGANPNPSETGTAR